MRPAIPAAIAAVVLAGAAFGLPRVTHAIDNGYAAAGDQRMTLARNGPDLFVLLQDIRRLRQEVRELRGRIQMLEHKIQRNSRTRQRMYQKLDKRLDKLEKRMKMLAQGARKYSKKEIENAYMAAFEKLQRSKYKAAIEQLEAFTEKYPANSYSDNAWYWLGQARYVQGNASGAMAALKKVIHQFPKSPKMPSTLFRMAVIQQERGNTEAARKTFKRIVSQYPDSETAAKARARLEDISGR